jgi:hypothetical protein
MGIIFFHPFIPDVSKPPAAPKLLPLWNLNNYCLAFNRNVTWSALDIPDFKAKVLISLPTQPPPL